MFPHQYIFKDGMMYPGDAPGLGVDLDENLAAEVSIPARLSAGESKTGRHPYGLVVRLADRKMIDTEEHIDRLAEPPALPGRWTICAMLFVATTINYMDRQVLSILKPFLRASRSI